MTEDQWTGRAAGADPPSSRASSTNAVSAACIAPSFVANVTDSGNRAATLVTCPREGPTEVPRQESVRWLSIPLDVTCGSRLRPTTQ